MSHFYAHLIVEVEPAQCYYLAEDARWKDGTIDDDAGLSRDPKYKGGPFNSIDEAIDRMTGRLGNPGYIDVMDYEEFQRIDEWQAKGLMENINPGGDDLQP